MKIEIHNYKDIAKSLKHIADTLDSLQAMYRHFLATQGIVLPDPKLSDEDSRVEIDYTDPEQDYVEEVKAAMSLNEEPEDE